MPGHRSIRRRNNRGLTPRATVAHDEKQRLYKLRHGCLSSKVCHGKPVFEGTGILVSNILADLAIGGNAAQIAEDYLGVGAEDIKPVLEFSAERASFDSDAYDVEITDYH
jgi:uncharacterized protein (DUF433 family)